MAQSPASSFGIYLAVSYDVIAATNSSPQTTEINAKARAKTLMKWVWIGIIQSMFFGLIGAAMEKKAGNKAWPPLVGSFTGVALLWAQYAYALKSGTESNESPTETYNSQPTVRGRRR